MPRIEVIYAAALKRGDLFAGTINPNAPTRSVLPLASALELADAYVDGARRMVSLEAVGIGPLTPLRATTQVMVIRL